MSNIWFCSDTHFGHDRDFIWQPRGFNNVYEMNKAIIKNWNSVIQKDDIVYHLGDLMLGDNQEGLKCVHQLNGIIYLCIGNHDTDSRIKLYKNCYNIANVQFAYRLKIGHKSFYLSHYPTMIGNLDENIKVWNICGHSHTKNKYQDMQYKIYHAELDCHNNFPVSLEEVKIDINNYIRKSIK